MRFKIYHNILCIGLLLFTTSCRTESGDAKPVSADTVSTKFETQKTSAPQDNIPQPNGFVNDYEKIFTPAEKDSLETMIELFEKETTIQIAVVTLDSTMTTAATLDEITLQIAKAWGIGQKDKNNGIVIGFSSVYRKMRIQNGYGIEGTLSDAETKKIIDEDFIPSFIGGKYFEGMKKGLLSLMRKLRGKYTA